MRLNAAADLHINKFSGAGIVELESGMLNAVVEKRSDQFYITQRPSVDVFGDASVDISDARGRAIIYWDEKPSLYIFNEDTIYLGEYGTVLSTTPTAGTKKSKFVIFGILLLLIDYENNQLFTISTGGTVTEVTDTDFPPKQTPAVPLAYGGGILNNILYVLGTNGVIYNSANNNATAWDPLDFIEAEREEDGGVYLGKHHDNWVAFGPSTIEFFYDAGNAVGSPLSRRQDISHNLGCTSGESVWEEGDLIFFIGVTPAGSLGIYKLFQFQPVKISTSTMDSFITQAIERDGFGAVGAGVSGQGHIFYTLTLYTTPSDIVPDITLVYDDTAGLWGEWETTVNGLSKFPLVSWTKRGGASERFGEGILTNGDLISINDNLTPIDTLLGATYVVTGYVEIGYVTDTGDTGTNITLKSRLGMVDLGTTLHKYPSSYTLASDLTPNSQTLTLRWADENNTSFTTGKTFDTSIYDKATRNGRFRRRNHEIEYTGSDQIRLEAIEAEIPVGDN